MIYTHKKFYHVRSIKIETSSSVGIGDNHHTPIIEDDASVVSVSDLFDLVKTYDPEFKPHPPRVTKRSPSAVLYYAVSSINRIIIDAVSARVAVPLGARVVSLLPDIIPTETAHSKDSCAQSDILSASA